MTRSTYDATVLRLQELSQFILDLKSIRKFGLPTILEKYQSSEFASRLQTISASRRGFEEVLVKSVLEKIDLLKTLDRAIIAEDTTTTEVIEPIKEVSLDLVTKKKSKKKK